MMYLDNGATSMPKPPQVARAVVRAMERCGNPGRGGHRAAMEAARTLFDCRMLAAQMFRCQPEQVAFTFNCTHGLNMAIRTLVSPGARVVVSGFEHNAVTRPLYQLGAEVTVAGERLFDWDDTLEAFETALKKGADAAVFTHVSNVFGYILPVEQMAALCRHYQIPFAVDAAQSAGSLPIDLAAWGADFVAMPGHKGLLGPQGTGLLLCGRLPAPLLCGGTGSLSLEQQMPQMLPDRAEAGTVNVPGIAGLAEGLRYVNNAGASRILRREQNAAAACVQALEALGLLVFSGAHQAGTVSFLPPGDGEVLAQALAEQGIAVRAGLHCAPLAHRSAGTLETGTVRVSFGHEAVPAQGTMLAQAVARLRRRNG